MDIKEKQIKKIKFPGRAGFYLEVKKRVNQYFEENNISQNANWRMVIKTISILLWLVGSYALFLSTASSLLWVVISAFAMAQGFVLVGFNIMHDGAHGSYSKNKHLNWAMGFTLDLIGGSNLFWRHKHNILHHTYTNILEHDNDLESLSILRFSPDQPWRPINRFQHLYAFPLYSLMTIRMVTSGDFQKLFAGKIGTYDLPKIPLSEVILLFVTKAFYFGYMLVLPMFFYPVVNVLLFFLVTHIVLGFTMAIIFQLAHVMEENEFPQPDPESGIIENEWAVHQVETTANFAPKSKFAAWYCGGLNFQIEHHLFPRICHIHYPEISKIVRRACDEFKINYVSYPTMRQAVIAHWRYLKQQGNPQEAPA